MATADEVESFGRRMAAARRAKFGERDGVRRSQQALADAVGCSLETVRKYEARSDPPVWSKWTDALQQVLNFRFYEDEPLDPHRSTVGDYLAALNDRVGKDADIRRSVLPLVAKLAAGEWSDEAERDHWRARIEAALLGGTPPGSRRFAIRGVDIAAIQAQSDDHGTEGNPAQG